MMKKEKNLIILFFLIQSIIHNLGHPVTPAFVTSLGIPYYMFGVFFATMSFGLVIGGPIWGALGDRGNKKIYIVIGLLIYSVGQFFFGYIGNQYLMIVFRFVSGFGVVASITLYTSHLIEITGKGERAKYLAFMAAAGTLGASLGYYLGGFIAENSFTQILFNITNNKEIFFIQAVVNLLYVGLIILIFTNTKPEKTAEKKIGILDGFKSIGKIDYRLLLFLIALIFISIGQINIDKYLDVYFSDLGYDPLAIGKFKLVMGGAILVSSLFLVPYFARFKKQIGLMMTIQVISAVVVFYTFRASNFIIMAYTVFMVYILFRSVFTPLEQNYISLRAKKGEYGRFMGTRQSFIALGFVIGPLVGGFIYEINPIWLFNSSAIAFLIGFVILFIVSFLYKKGKTSDSV